MTTTQTTVFLMSLNMVQYLYDLARGRTLARDYAKGQRDIAIRAGWVVNGAPTLAAYDAINAREFALVRLNAAREAARAVARIKAGGYDLAE